MSDIAERVQKIVVEHLGVDEGKVSENASFIDANLIRECCLKWFLPVILKCSYSIFCATTCVTHPTKTLGKKFTHIIDAMVIQPVNHTLDDGTGFISLCHVCIAAENRLFGS